MANWAGTALLTMITSWVLVFSGCLSLSFPADPHEGHSHPQHADGHAHHPLEAPLFDIDSLPDLVQTPPFPLEEGRRPSPEEAKQFVRRYTHLTIQGNESLDRLRAEGLLAGNGTPDKPYILERFFIESNLLLANLHRSLILREGYVGGQLRLNYVGESLYVHHVYAKDLRVNENIKRTGNNTGGLFHDNEFGFVGQLRHFTGEFRDNKIGPKPQNLIHQAWGDTGIIRVPDAVALNLDGFHRAHIHHNEIHGQLDIKLHGHNHGDCFTCPVHNHADLDDQGHDNHTLPENPHGFTSIHNVRHASLLVHDNTILVPSGVALRYHDRNHAADDRTAASEPHTRLKDDHVHYQDVTLRNNTLHGGTLLIDVYNAQDPKHPAQNQGVLRLWGNSILVHHTPSTPLLGGPTIASGIQVRQADGLQLSVRGAVVDFREQSARPQDEALRTLARKVELRGLELLDVKNSNLTIEDSLVRTGRYGVWAQNLHDTTHWWLLHNQFKTDEPWRGKNVAHPPTEQ